MTLPTGLTRSSLALAALIEELERARTEEPLAIDRAWRERMSRAERLRDESAAAAESRLGRKGEALRARHSEERDAAALGIAGERTAIDRDRVDRTRRIEEWASESLAAAKNQLEESIWVAESVYEGAVRGPEDRERAVLHSIEQRRELIASLREEAAQQLARYRHPVPAAPPAGTRVPESGTAFDALETAVEAVRSAHDAIARDRCSTLSSGIMPALLIITALAIAVATALGLSRGEVDGTLLPAAAGGVAAGIVLTLLLRGLGRRSTRRAMVRLLEQVAAAEQYGEKAAEDAAEQRSDEQAALRATRDRDITGAKDALEPAMSGVRTRRERKLAQFKSEAAAAIKTLDAESESSDRAMQKKHEEEERAFEREQATAAEEIEGKFTAEELKAAHEREEAHRAFHDRWRRRMDMAQDAVAASLQSDAERTPPWSDSLWQTWEGAETACPAFRIARLPIDREAIARAAGATSEPDDPRLAVTLPARFELPVGPDLRDGGGLLIEADERGRDAALDLLRLTMMRILSLLPPGKARFTIIDPVGLGESFAGFMHLADYDEKLVTSRIWTEPRHIEQRLADLTEHMETVIQKYLRNEFETIEAYNEQAGEIAEPYRFLVLADFPASFSESAAARLASIVISGARCGVYVLLAHDRRAAVPASADLATIRSRCVRLVHDPKEGGFLVHDGEREERVLVDEAPPDELKTKLLRQIGERARNTARVEVPFSVVAPSPEEVWSRRCDHELSVPLGRAGATRLQEITFGTGTSQHALLAGKTGSGKSTLLHVLITNVALWYPPDEVELYLIDFKKGVEFKTYASLQLPHARAVAVESDREFGLSVLQRVDQELRERGDLYRDAGVQDLAGFRRAKPGHRMPRVLLVVDEFQEMFVEDDRVGQEASLLLDRIVRQGRAFGIHVLLGSQTLGGAYSIARSTMGQIQIRIALQCSEADSYLIMNEDNAAARLLSRPGEAIYNDAGGRIEGNSPFQIVWLSEDEREERLQGLNARPDAAQRGSGQQMFVFEGSAPALLAANPLLRSSRSAADRSRSALRAWIGDAVAIKGPTEAALRPQSGSNLLVVGQRDEAAAAMFVASLASFAAQRGAHDPGPRLLLLDGLPIDAPQAGLLTQAAGTLGLDAETPGYREIDSVFAELDEELTRRMDSGASDARPIVLLILGLQRFRMLRTSDDFSFSMDAAEGPPAPDKVLSRLLREGPVHRMHAIIWCDTPANLTRTLDRTALREMSMRVLFQMGGNDSTTLIDSPAASMLGMHRALFYDEELGILEKFRPYAMPEDDLLASLAGHGNTQPSG